MLTLLLGAVLCISSIVADQESESPPSIHLCSICAARNLKDPLAECSLVRVGKIEDVKNGKPGIVNLKIHIDGVLRGDGLVGESLELSGPADVWNFMSGQEVMLLGHEDHGKTISWHVPYVIGPQGQMDLETIIPYPISDSMDEDAIKYWVKIALDKDRPFSLWAAERLSSQPNSFWMKRRTSIDSQAFHDSICVAPLGDYRGTLLCRVLAFSDASGTAEFLRTRFVETKEKVGFFFGHDLICAVLISGKEPALVDLESQLFGSPQTPDEIRHWDGLASPLLQALLQLHDTKQGSFSTERVGLSMSRLFDERIAVDMLVQALQRIECWDYTQQIASMKIEGQNERSLRAAILRYMNECESLGGPEEKSIAKAWLLHHNQCR